MTNNSTKTIEEISSHLINILKKDNSQNNVVSIIGFVLLLRESIGIKTLNLNPYISNKADMFLDEIVFNNNNFSKLIDVWNIIRDDFKTLKLVIVDEIIHILDNNLTHRDYISLFDEILLQSTYNHSINFKENFQPDNITRLIVNLSDSEKIMNIYNPFAGFASYGIYFGKKHHYIGQELNAKIWAIGMIRLILNSSDAHYTLEDSIQHWNESNKQYDLIVSTPPFGHRINEVSFSERKNPYGTSVEEFFISKGIKNCLTPNGKLIGLLSEGFLFSSEKSKYSLRKELIDKGLVEMVISLPSNIFYNAAIKTSIIVLNMGLSGYHNKIKCVDGTSFYKSIGSKNILLENDLLNETCLCNDKYVRFVSPEEIKKNDYRLDVSRYFIEEIEVPNGYEKIKLREVLKYNSNREKFLKDNLNILSISDLTTNQFDYEREYCPSTSNQPRNQLNGIYCALNNLLLLSLRFQNLKATYYKSLDNNPIYYSANLAGFHVISDTIDIGYLIYELNADYVKKQIEATSIGTVMSYMRVNDFLNVEILLPPLQEQKAIVKGAKEAYQIASAKELGLEEVIERMKNDYIDEMRIKKHNLAQYVNNLQSSVSALVKFVEKNNGSINKNQLISTQRHITVDQHLQNMLITAKEIGSFVNNLTYDLEFGTPSIINLDKFIQSYIKKYSQEKFEFRYYFDKESFVDLKNFYPTTSIADSDLIEVFNNIVKNAENHGFLDTNYGNYVISISLSFDVQKKMLKVDIANNGKSMPKGMDISRYTLKNEKAGVTGNEGLGGFRINQIIKHYGGIVELITDEKNMFPVTVSLYLPLINKL
jgi:type I restriction enzyme M protein